jgi:high-affinity iron transporter
MLAAAAIVFHDMLELALVVGLAMAVTRGIAGSRAWIAAGIGSGLAGAVLLATAAESLSDAMDGFGQELFFAGILAAAVVMLARHVAWMARHPSPGSRPPLSALAVVVAVAVLREGAEAVLFVFGVSTSSEEGTLATALGCGAGLAGGILAGAALYFGLAAVPLRFAVTASIQLLSLLAAGLAAQAVAFLSAAGLWESGSEPLWDSSAILSEDGIPGKVLHTLAGYVDHPSLSQIGVYGLTLAMFAVMIAYSRRPSAGSNTKSVMPSSLRPSIR